MNPSQLIFAIFNGLYASIADSGTYALDLYKTKLSICIRAISFGILLSTAPLENIKFFEWTNLVILAISLIISYIRILMKGKYIIDESLVVEHAKDEDLLNVKRPDLKIYRKGTSSSYIIIPIFYNVLISLVISVLYSLGLTIGFYPLVWALFVFLVNCYFIYNYYHLIPSIRRADVIIVAPILLEYLMGIFPLIAIETAFYTLCFIEFIELLFLLRLDFKKKQFHGNSNGEFSLTSELLLGLIGLIINLSLIYVEYDMSLDYLRYFIVITCDSICFWFFEKIRTGASE
jgi:hypothetical protein